jgi:hypothetical protein
MSFVSSILEDISSSNCVEFGKASFNDGNDGFTYEGYFHGL